MKEFDKTAELLIDLVVSGAIVLCGSEEGQKIAADTLLLVAEALKDEYKALYLEKLNAMVSDK